MADAPLYELPEGWKSWSDADKEAFFHHLKYNWRLWARPEQVAPPGEWAVWAYVAGRGSGKTKTGSEWVREGANAAPGSRWAAIGPTAGDVRDTLFEGVSGLLAVIPDTEMDDYNRSTQKIRLRNGSEIKGFSGETPDRLRGPQHHGAWVDELAAMPYAQDVWDQMMFGLRLGTRPQVMLTTTPRPIPLLRKILAREDAVVSNGRTMDNVANLSEAAVRELYEAYEGTWLAGQELEGRMIDEAPGALWTVAVIEASRVDPRNLPQMTETVVVLDPAVSAGPKADETGVVVVGKGADGDVYVLDDLSLKATPDGWARVAVGARDRYGASRILYEQNQGGLLVRETLLSVDPRVQTKGVSAVASKGDRAMPAVALFQQTKAHLAGYFPQLEQQMTGWEPGVSRYSPDRLDAMVHGVNYLKPRAAARVFAATATSAFKRRRDVLRADAPASRYS